MDNSSIGNVGPLGSVGRGEQYAEKNCEPFKDIGWALTHLRARRKAFRAGWNGNGMWLEIQYPDLHSKMSQPYIYMHTADNNLVPWVASQSDLLACDWAIIRD